MPRQLWIDDHIEMRGDALHRSNMDGPWQETMVHFHDHFLADTINLDFYTVTVDTAGAAAINAAVGGQCRFKTSSTNSGISLLATSINWEDDMYARCEARIKVAEVDYTALFFGFSDAVTEATTVLPIDYDGGSLTIVASNAVGFVMDPDQTTYGKSIMCCYSLGGAGASPVDSGKDWEDDAWHVLRIELTPDAKADFYIDGTSVAHINDALTSSTDLCMFMGVATRDTGAKYVYLDRWDAWQNES